MICPEHELRKPRLINGNCWYCRKAELRYLSEIEVENGLVKKRAQGLDIQAIRRICRLRRVARIQRFEINGPRKYSQTSGGDETLMSFEQIGKTLGVTAQRAQQIFERGLQKLRQLHPRACVELLELSELRHKCLPTKEANL